MVGGGSGGRIVVRLLSALASVSLLSCSIRVVDLIFYPFLVPGSLIGSWVPTPGPWSLGLFPPLVAVGLVGLSTGSLQGPPVCLCPLYPSLNHPLALSHALAHFLESWRGSPILTQVSWERHPPLPFCE